MLRYFDFEPSFKLRWRLAQDLFVLITNSNNHSRVWTANLLYIT